ncbi:MAG: histidine kinase [Xanthomonadales bacterium]|nr:histidine kinase [Xanthomonadales bacterium]
MPLRLKLLLIFAVALVFPVAGWRFVAEMEATLRQGQEAALLASARAVAQAYVSLRPQLIEATTEPGPFYVRPVPAALELDGYGDDWAGLNESAQALSGDRASDAQLALAVHDGRLYLWLDVRDRSAVRVEPGPGAVAPADHVDLWLADERGTRGYRLQSGGDGPVQVQPLVDEQGRRPTLGLVAVWRDTATGYRVEARVPAPDEPGALGLLVSDQRLADSPLALLQYGSGPDQAPARARHLLYTSPDDALLARLLPQQTRARVVGPGGHVIGRSGALSEAEQAEPDFEQWLRSVLYRWLLAPPLAPAEGMEPDLQVLQGDLLSTGLRGQEQVSWRPAGSLASVVLTAAVPLPQGHGVVLLERRMDALLICASRGLGGLLLGSLLGMALAAFILFGYASYLSVRIRFLRNAAENALTPEGRLREGFPRSRASDEIGDLSRSFARLLDQVHAYTGYLRSLAGKLSHELATPLAVVRSSLENLEQAELPDSARIYAERARGGAERLRSILRAMSEAGRIERAVDGAEAEQFDLAELVRNAAAGYRGLADGPEWRLRVPDAPLPFRGAPELLHQALDKLVDNALGFAPAEGWIEIGCVPTSQGARLWVSNAGPALPAEMQDRLFESLVSLRSGGEGPHLGLGLYIVRLVAELHHGQASAKNLGGGDGVVFSMDLRPL